jgi:tetratricopeptide (TPR) repeat protein
MGSKKMNEANETQKAKRTRGGIRIILLVLLVLLVGAALITGGALYSQSRETHHLEDARWSIARSDWEEASSALIKALNTQPAVVRQHAHEATALRGFVAYKMGNDAEALSAMDQALAMDPNLLDLLAYRADIHFRQNNHESALLDSHSALDHSALLDDHLLAMLHANLAVMKAASGTDQDVMAEVDAALPFAAYLQDQTLAKLYALRAISAYNLGDFETALEDTRLALSFEVDLADELLARLHANRAAMRCDQEQYDEFMAATAAALQYAAQLPDDDLYEIHRQRSQFLYDHGDLAEAIEEAEQAVTYGEDLSLLHALLALQSYQSFAEENAMTEAAIALSLDDQNALAHKIRGTLLAWQGDVHAALDHLQKAQDLQPNDLDTLAMCVRVHLALNDRQAAEDDLKQAVALAPQAPAALWAQAMVHYHSYEYQTARSLLDQAIAAATDRPEFYTLRSETYRQVAQIQDIENDLQNALALNPQFLDARAAASWNRAWSEGSEDSFAAFEQEMLEIIAAYPHYYEAVAMLADYHLRVTGDLQQAAAYAEKVEELLPESNTGKVLLADIYLADDEYDQALALIEKALEADHNDANALESLVNYHLETGDFESALDRVEQLKIIVPNDVRPLAKEAQVYLIMGDLEKAWIAAHRVLAEDPENQYALLVRADINRYTGKLQEALLDISRLLDSNPRSVEALLKRTLIHYLQGDMDAARQYAQRALAVDPDLGIAHGLLSDIALAENDLETALAQTELMIQKSPDMASGYYNQGLTNASMGNYEAALASYSAGLEVETEDDDMIGSLTFNRALINFTLGNKEEGLADLQAILESTTNVNILNDTEMLLAYPSEIPIIAGERFVIEDELLGFSLSYAQEWNRMENDPDIGQVLSLYLEEDAAASVDIFLLDWEDTVDAYATVIVDVLYDPERFTSQSLDAMSIAGEDGLVRQYELISDDGTLVEGRHYYGVKDDRAVFILVETYKGDFDRFADEFELIAQSFAFIP